MFSLSLFRCAMLHLRSGVVDTVISFDLHISGSLAIGERAVPKPVGPACRIVFLLPLPTNFRLGGSMAFILRDDQEALVAFQILDARGQVITDLAPTFGSSNPAVATFASVAPGTQGVPAGFMGGLITATGQTGPCQASVQVTNDPEEGGNTIIGTLDFEVHAGAAVAITLTAGTPGPIGSTFSGGGSGGATGGGTPIDPGIPSGSVDPSGDTASQGVG
jgi:hypothetical protein